MDLVEEGYDLAIRISRAGSPSLISRKLATSQNVVCASPDYIARHGAPQVPEDLMHHVCIGYTYSATGDEWGLIDDAGSAHRVAVSTSLQTNNGDTARATASRDSASSGSRHF